MIRHARFRLFAFRAPPRLALILAAVAGLGALAGPAQAQDCQNALTQMDLNQCAARDYERADVELNRTWKGARDRAKAMDANLPANMGGIWQALLDGQRAWITYRDKTCEAEGGPMRGGSAEPLLVLGCKERLTWARARDLDMFGRY